MMQNLSRRALALVSVALLLGAAAHAQQQKIFKPQVGQPGKDVVWVPTPPELVATMMDLAEVTPQDFVMDLGSGDGRLVIAAASRGARALGVEYNPDMLELSRRNATEAGVAGRATFVQGDMYQADISKASVMALFLLPSNLIQLRDKFLDLAPGTRIVANTFGIQDWTADETVILDDCSAWCTALLWIVPAKVEGRWRLPQGDLLLTQEYQMLSGRLETTPIANGRLRGEEIAFTAGEAQYSGRINENHIEGTVRNGGTESDFTATRFTN